LLWKERLEMYPMQSQAFAANCERLLRSAAGK
jgi:hypothetical protein